MTDSPFSKMDSHRFPLFTVANKAAIHKYGLPPAIIKPRTDEHGLFFPLFTDEDLATRFIEATTKRKLRRTFTVVELLTINSLHAIAEFLESQGCRYVGLDVSFFGRQPQGQFIPIREFLEECQEWR